MAVSQRVTAVGNTTCLCLQEYFNLPFNFYPQTEVGMPLRNVPRVDGASCQAREWESPDSCDETRTTCAYGTKFDLVWCP